MYVVVIGLNVLGGPARAWTITPTGVGHVHLAPLGIELVPVALTEADADHLNELVTLDRTSHAPGAMINDQ